MGARRAGTAAGFSLVEIAVVVGMVATVSAVAIPQLLAGLDDSRAAGAAHYVMTRFHQARMLAVTRSANVGIRFVAVTGGFEFSTVVDGNGNGIRTADLARGIDVPVGVPERLPWNFAGVDFGALASTPPADGATGTVGADPIKFGTSNIASFSPDGSSSSGSVYLLGRRGAQYVVRVFGDTGRIRMMKFNRSTQKWLTLQ